VTLRRKATAGAFWVGVSTALKSLFRMITRFILQRNLLPADFGLIMMAYTVIDFLRMFREMGFSYALIYRKGDVRKAADTTFVMTMAIAVVLFLIAFFSAPYVAVFYRSKDLLPVMRVLSVNILIAALGEVQLSLLAKNLAFREKLLPDLVPKVAYGLVAISLSLMGMGVWSIVIANIVDSVLTSVMAWVVVPWWRPKMRFYRQEAEELFKYGKHILGSGILIWLITNLDSLFVGRVLDEQSLGYYGSAYYLANLPATHISRVVSQVLFPAYSKIQEDVVAMRAAFFKTMHYVSLVSVPVAVGTIFFAAPFIDTVYGARWAPMIVPLQLLGIYGLLRSVAVNMGSVLKAGGKPNWLTYIATFRLAVMGLFLYPAAKYGGIVGVSAFSAVVSIVDFFISAILTNRIVRGRASDYVRCLWVPMAFSVLSALLARYAYGYMVAGGGFMALVMGGALMIGIYAALVFVVDCDARDFARSLLADVGQASRKLLGNGM